MREIITKQKKNETCLGNRHIQRIQTNGFSYDLESFVITSQKEETYKHTHTKQDEHKFLSALQSQSKANRNVPLTQIQ